MRHSGLLAGTIEDGNPEKGHPMTTLTARGDERGVVLPEDPGAQGYGGLAASGVPQGASPDGPWGKCADAVLVGRSVEREALGGLLARAADGFGGALLLQGEAGVGKTALLDETVVAAAAGGMRVVRLTGVEAEAQLRYAGMHRFLLPFADQLERLPVPQRDALRSTFGMVAGPPANRFLVALGVLTLLGDVASQAPLVCVVDDVQWLDPESAVLLGFVARRLAAERVVLLFAVREAAAQAPALAGVPELAIGRLDDDAALDLLASLAPGRLSPAVGARIVAGTGGNPLALTEVAGELSPGQLAGSEVLPEPLPVAGSLKEAFGRRVGQLPAEARLLLAAAAAEPGCSQALLWRAAAKLGIDPETAGMADLSDLAEIGPQVVFRHPMVRSVAYYSTPPRQRRLIHQALAAAGDAGQQPDRVVWHLANAADQPDEAVAGQLEQAAERACHRDGHAAAVALLSRAAELSVNRDLRAGRLFAAAEAALTAGQPNRASALLEEAARPPGDPLSRARATRLQGAVRFAAGQAGEASTILLEAARAFEPIDARTARGALLEAFEAALSAGRTLRQAALADVARAARAIPGPGDPGASATDLLLDGFAARMATGYTAGVPSLRRAIAKLRAVELSAEEGLRRLRLGCLAAEELWDDQAQHALATRCVQLARDSGAPMILAVALSELSAVAEVSAGRLDAARACIAEGREIPAATANPGMAETASGAEMFELAWRGREQDARRLAAVAASQSARADRDSHDIFTQHGLAVLELGLGNYQAALRSALTVYEADAPPTGTRVLPDLVEAAARSGETELAHAAVARLADRALAAGTELALGLLTRSRALLAGDGDAENLYQEAIGHLNQCTAAPQLARAHLVFGEWLRRQRRRRDAREQLRTAHDMFASIGAEAFAERARVELLATGEHARQRTAGTQVELTAREAQIARLVGQGESNRDIATQLYISPATVDYHLRKVFRKVGVASRTQLARTMVTNRSSTTEPAIA
ncbi:MAG TPA: AAA family ATPase [Trebonia sp.]|nr:AAA family ATPase [Trebonia sp.]